jgi:hypothetical protein
MENCIFCKPQRDVKQNIVFENNTCYFLKHDNEKQILVGCGGVVLKVHHINVKATWVNIKDAYNLPMQKSIRRRFPLFFEDGIFEIHVEWNNKKTKKVRC